ncbi:hypothetical protein GCM10010339_69440 [Streptomyces alanosinicus]|uniref:Uncharacterized protein n=1 Tax=Streptomyces alanosinicus TaxID=68171 RepID=A0A919D5X9_9ACTN|nr:hypothetical protein GCM10010339_69440 [Streptomyces alanosinicus]
MAFAVGQGGLAVRDRRVRAVALGGARTLGLEKERGLATFPLARGGRGDRGDADLQDEGMRAVAFSSSRGVPAPTIIATQAVALCSDVRAATATPAPTPSRKVVARM